MVADPVATAAQHEQELAALDLIEQPVVKAAYQTVAETWLGRAKASEAMRERFDDAFAEVMFSAAVWSSNQDKLRPKVSCITRLAHPVDGRRIPGSRWGIDNPDSVYRVIPISGDERYEIRGRVGDQPLGSGGHVERPQTGHRVGPARRAQEGDGAAVRGDLERPGRAQREALSPGLLPGKRVRHGARYCQHRHELGRSGPAGHRCGQAGGLTRLPA